MTPDAMAETLAIRQWLERRRAAAGMQVVPSALARSPSWRLEDGVIRHASGRFFQVVGLNWCEGGAAHCQPFIAQREIGTLGFLTRRTAHGLALLLHAKAEPGNVGIAQIGPTCQATASNRDRVHGGALPPYAAAFADEAGSRLSDSLQSEQGSRFLGKFNRNVVVLSDGTAPVGDDHRWAAFDALRPLLLDDFLINTDARSVICTTPWALLAGRAPFPGEDARSRALSQSFRAPVRLEALARVEAALRHARHATAPAALCPVDRLPGWRFDPGGATTLTDGKLALRHIDVRAASREVAAWDQPILDSGGEQTIDLDGRHENGALHFAFRAAWEPGLGAGAELAPTRMGEDRPQGKTLLQARQSDEGGRFLHDVALYRVRDVTGGPEDPDLLWLSLSEIHHLLPRGFFNNEARSAISLLLALA